MDSPLAVVMKDPRLRFCKRGFSRAISGLRQGSETEHRISVSDITIGCLSSIMVFSDAGTVRMRQVKQINAILFHCSELSLEKVYQGE
jgi:hypothetical protein